MNSRILTVTGSADGASQYMNYMNVFFTAQKQVSYESLTSIFGRQVSQLFRISLRED